MKLSEMEVHIKQIEKEKQDAYERMINKQRWAKKQQDKKEPEGEIK